MSDAKPTIEWVKISRETLDLVVRTLAELPAKQSYNVLRLLLSDMNARDEGPELMGGLAPKPKPKPPTKQKRRAKKKHSS